MTFLRMKAEHRQAQAGMTGCYVLSASAPDYQIDAIVYLKLPDFCEVCPAHGAGSLCGRTMGAKRTSTIGYEKKYNTALLINSKEEFIKSLTTDMPAAPDHFRHCSSINRDGPELVSNLPAIEELSPEAFSF